MYFQIVTSAFYLLRQKMLKFEGWYSELRVVGKYVVSNLKLRLLSIGAIAQVKVLGKNNLNLKLKYLRKDP